MVLFIDYFLLTVWNCLCRRLALSLLCIQMLKKIGKIAFSVCEYRSSIIHSQRIKNNVIFCDM